jgi:hypothetical protein
MHAIQSAANTLAADSKIEARHVGVHDTLDVAEKDFDVIDTANGSIEDVRAAFLAYASDEIHPTKRDAFKITTTWNDLYVRMIQRESASETQTDSDDLLTCVMAWVNSGYPV